MTPRPWRIQASAAIAQGLVSNGITTTPARSASRSRGRAPSVPRRAARGISLSRGVGVPTPTKEARPILAMDSSGLRAT
jgi:hypothetical protein